MPTDPQQQTSTAPNNNQQPQQGQPQQTPPAPNNQQPQQGQPQQTPPAPNNQQPQQGQPQQTPPAPNNQQPQPLQQSGQQTPNWPNIWNTQRHRIIKARKEQENPRNDDEKNNKITKEVEVGMLSQQQFETVVQKMASQINGNNLSQSPTILDNENNGKRIQRATFPDGGCYIREQKLEEKKAKVTYQLPSGQCVNTNDKDALFNIFQKIAYGLASEYKIKFDRQEINGLPLTIEEASIQPSTQEAQNACQQALQNVGFQVKMLKKNETFETKFNVFNP